MRYAKTETLTDADHRPSAQNKSTELTNLMEKVGSNMLFSAPCNPESILKLGDEYALYFRLSVWVRL